MSAHGKPTAGPWTVDTKYSWVERSVRPAKEHAQVLAPNGDLPTPVARCQSNAQAVDNHANAALIAEAGTVLHETGKSPRQLADEVERLTRERSWQPIETAPKDAVTEYAGNSHGDRILVWDGTSAKRARWWENSRGAGNFIDDGGNACLPSHWMPLPAAPAVLAEQQTAGEQG